MQEGLSVIFQYARSYAKSGFHLGYFGIVSIVMAFLIYLNYTGLLDQLQRLKGPQGFVFDYLFFLLPFVFAWIIQRLFMKTPFFLNPWLIILVLICPLFFTIRVNLDFHNDILKEYLSENEFKFWNRCAGWLIRASILIALIAILWFFKDRHSGPLYGTRMPAGSFRPYLLMVGLAIPLVIFAATNSSFQNTYPRAGMISSLGFTEVWRYLVFESSYAFDFLSIELFFRGLLIIGFMRIAGMNCILPAAVFYCCIHFGKPLGEAISSYFGGLLLGIVSYHTKSIRGGLIVHIGLAFLMELAGFIARGLAH